MKAIKIDDLNKIIAEVEQERPYKERGNRDSYSSYNEGWSDALGTLQGKIEATKAEEGKSIDKVTEKVDPVLFEIMFNKQITDLIIESRLILNTVYNEPIFNALGSRIDVFNKAGAEERLSAINKELVHLISSISNSRSKSIDKVTVGRLDVALRLCSIQIDRAILDRVIDVVELLEEKGGETSLEDICDLQYKWKGKCT